MIASIDISNNGQFGLKDVANKLSQYFEELRVNSEKKKEARKIIKEETERKMFIDDLLYNYSTQKTFFDFFDNMIKQEGQKMIANSTKEEAMYFCDQMSSTIQKIEDIQMNYESRDFENLDAFFAFNSAFALINSIISLYYDMLKIAEAETENFLLFIEKQIEKSLKESPKRTKVNSVSDFLNAL